MDETQLNQARARLEELGKVLPRGRRVLIVPHDYPDPDALASAAALHLLLLKHFHVQGQIVFTGMVSRAENKVMLKSCRYRWRLLSQVRQPKGKLPCLFVDAKPWAGNVTTPPFGRPVAVFDHHPVARDSRLGGIVADIRAGVGATVSILYEYLAAAGVPIPRWLAAMMAYAIATETLDLSRNCTPLDLEAYTALLSRANMTIVGEMRHAPLPRSYYIQLQEAIRHASVCGRVAFTHLDAVEQPEIVPEVADLLCRMERVTWSFCTGFHEENLIVSVRSAQKGAHGGKVLKSVLRRFGGSGGGHDWMAAGYIGAAGLTPVDRLALRENFAEALLRKIEKRPIQAEPLVGSGSPAAGKTGD